jgi:Tfp pilus assembly protein PilF
MAEKILEKDPSNAKAGIILAESYNGDGKFQKAAKVYTDMIKNEPENMDLVFRLGIVYNNAEYHLNAAEAFKKVVEVQPGNMVAHHRLGVSYALGMDLSKAYDEYRILKKHDEKLAKDLLDYIQTNNR